MKINMSKTLFLMVMMITVMMMMSSNNIMILWMSMEINMISFLPILTKSKKSMDQPMKYFIIQSVSSSIMLMSTMLNTMTELPLDSSLVLMTSMLMKMGMMPFHLWLPSTMQKITWENCMILSTIQKIPPVLILNQIIKFKMMILPMVLSSILGSIAAINQVSFKKIMAYSSISNSTWMISSIFFSKQMFLVFMMVYSMLTITIMKKMKTENIMYMNQMNTMKKDSKLNFTINMMSLSGIPPLLGFLPKWFILQNMIQFSSFMSIVMILSSCISTFIYMKIASMMMIEMTITKKMKKEKSMYNISMMMNLTGIPMMIMLKSI
uniref:NADH dehydrogenase subunit 2 n=1 Tax=Gergithoides gibbosus TaxID=3081102 RepID=UPI002E7837FB|nr:NADH dehydrogenase subunit 2 [Gergithoides gibbosus]WQB38491.1 NADH dehydrogenase subunit 2 [Gergithoides gibbosus]